MISIIGEDVRLARRRLAKYMLEWEEIKVNLDNLEDEIKQTVLDLGKTVEVGNVRASYRKGSTSYDYLDAVSIAQDSFDEEDFERLDQAKEKHSKVSTTTSWKAVCEELDLEPVIKSESKPSVTVKLC